jgi:von Willebrand factor type A domain-containing protein
VTSLLAGLLPGTLLLGQQAPKLYTRIRFDALPEGWIVFLIAIMIVAFASACYLLERKGERRYLKPFLAVLRIVILLLVVLILFRPLESRELRDEKLGYVAVAIDVSRSMEFKDRERDAELRGKIGEALGVDEGELLELTRLDRIRTAFRKDQGAFLKELAAKNRVRFFTFSSTRQRLSKAELSRTEDEAKTQTEVATALAELDALAPDGSSTALGDSLQRIVSDMRNEQLAGLILLTDGRTTSGSVNGAAVASRLGRKGVKVYAVGVGDAQPRRDLALDDLRAPDVTLAGDVLAGSLVVRAQGYEERRRATVRVFLQGTKIFEETGEVGGDAPEWQVAFSTKVSRPGEYMLKAEVTPDPEEQDLENNVSKPRRVRVIDERIRVLYVEGYPRWEYRYLKNALVRDKHMEVQCLLVSADPEFVQESSPGVVPLKRLPSQEELLKYHVIIIGDVKPEARGRDGEPVFYDGALKTIRELVKERAGGLLMLSGSLANPRLYGTTPLADVLPVEVEEGGFSSGDFRRDFHPRLTREGLTSPLLKLERDDERNRVLWEEKLRGFYWYAEVKRAKPAAHVLGVHPRARNNAPLFAWHRFGAGTCFWIGVDETWRWRAEVGDKYPYRFYGQILRFLSLQSFTRSKRFYITTDKRNYDVGEKVRVTAEVRDEQAAQAPKQEVLLDLPNGQSETLSLAAVKGEPGKFTATYKPVQTGGYRLYAEPGDRFGADEIASREFDVVLPRLETQEPRMDETALKRIASESGGKYMRLDELGAVPAELTELRERILVSKKERNLWEEHRWWVFALLFGVLLAEWLGRKAARLL